MISLVHFDINVADAGQSRPRRPGAELRCLCAGIDNDKAKPKRTDAPVEATQQEKVRDAS